MGLSGVGLLLNVRAAFLPALLFALTVLGFGVYTMSQPGDITAPDAFIVSLVILVLPGALMLAVLLSPRSLRWFRRNEAPQRPDGAIE